MQGEDGDSADGQENEGGEEFWKMKCISLQKQVDLLKSANTLLGQQIKEKAVSKVKKLLGGNEEEKRVENGQTCFSVFPEELWEIILEYLGDSQDLLNVCRTCNQMDTVLHSSKGTWMFKFVINDIFKMLNREDIINCRLVCKKWNVAIENLLEDHVSRRPFSHSSSEIDTNISNSLKLLTSATFHLWDVERLRTLRHEMSHHPRNPFLGRSVIFNVEIDDDFDEEDEYDVDDSGIIEFWEHTRMLLRSVGHHLYYLELTEDSGHQKPLEFYKLLRDLLHYLPNLRSLKIAVDISHEDYHPKALPLYMANYPLPVMPHLESLDIECLYPEVPQIIHDMLIAMYSTQLSKLHLNMSRWKNCYSRGLKNLTELNLKEISFGRLTFLEAPKLGKISLDLRESSSSLASSSSSSKISTNSLFEILSRFTTLRVIKLIVDITVELKEIETSKLCSIPSLEQLEIHGVQRKISYSFLLCFPSIKNIIICESISGNKFNEDPAVIAFLEGDLNANIEEVVEVQKYMYNRRMYESNVWRLLPDLKMFSFERVKYGELIYKHKCHREVYEYRNKITANPSNVNTET